MKKIILITACIVLAFTTTEAQSLLIDSIINVKIDNSFNQNNFINRIIVLDSAHAKDGDTQITVFFNL